MTTLDKDFKRIERQVRAKMKQAADLIREANEMVSAVDKTIPPSQHTTQHTLSDDDWWDACKSFREAVNEAGWRSSSMNC